MNWRCWLLGHEHRFRAAVVRRVERAGIVQFRCWHVKRCYRCPDEIADELPQHCNAREVVKLFQIDPEMLGPVEGRRFRLSLDGRPMGYITQINNAIPNGWNATRPNGCMVRQGLTKEEAAAALW